MHASAVSTNLQVFAELRIPAMRQGALTCQHWPLEGRGTIYIEKCNVMQHPEGYENCNSAY